MTTKMEKAEILNEFFPFQLSLVVSLPRSLESLNLKVRDRGNKVLPTVGVDQDLDHLRNVYIQKFMGPMKHMPALSGKWLMVNPVFP